MKYKQRMTDEDRIKHQDQAEPVRSTKPKGHAFFALQTTSRRGKATSSLIAGLLAGTLLAVRFGFWRGAQPAHGGHAGKTVAVSAPKRPSGPEQPARTGVNSGAETGGQVRLNPHGAGLGSASTPAPDFALTDQDGRTHHLIDYRGRPIVLAFYPQATPDVQAELRSFKKSVYAFDGVGAKIFAISATPQSVRKALHDREKLPFPLLSDPDGTVAALYHALDGTHHIKNCTVVVDASGWITLSMPAKAIRHNEHGKQILNVAQCSFVPMLTSAVGKIGTTGANFILPRVDTGKTETLYGDHTAKATVVIFLSSKCPCSRGYEARMKALAARYTPLKVRFLGINSNADESSWDAAMHQRRAGFPFPILRDDGNAIADLMEARVTPEAFLLDARGMLLYHGRIDDDRSGRRVQHPDLANALKAVLAGKHPSVASAPGFGCAIVRKKSPASKVVFN